MKTTDLERYTSALVAKQTELHGSMRVRDEIVIEKVADAADEVQLMGERELALRNLDRDSKALRLVRNGLNRIANSTYGMCLNCEEEISPNRLTAVPWAAFCIKCQEKIDRREIEIDEMIDVHSLAA